MRKALVTALLFSAALFAGPASAHTSLISTAPEANESLTELPTQIVIIADGSIQEPGTAIVVTGPDGSRVDDGSTQVEGSSVLVGLGPSTQSGTYTVNYRLVAEDGHALEGSYGFAVAGEPTPTPTPTPTETDEPVEDESGPSGSLAWILVAALIAAITSLALLTRAARRNR
jgi:copper resistance protein C